MEFSFDEEADALYIYISRVAIVESEPLNKNLVIDYDKDRNICGIEILNYSHSNLDLNKLIRLTSNEIITQVTASR